MIENLPNMIEKYRKICKNAIEKDSKVDLDLFKLFLFSVLSLPIYSFYFIIYLFFLFFYLLIYFIFLFVNLFYFIFLFVNLFYLFLFI